MQDLNVMLLSKIEQNEMQLTMKRFLRFFISIDLMKMIECSRFGELLPPP